MNRKLGLIVSICIALIGFSVLYFGISSYSAIAEQTGELIAKPAIRSVFAFFGK